MVIRKNYFILFNREIQTNALTFILYMFNKFLQNFLPDLISSRQTAYVKNIHIGESGRLMSDVIEIVKMKKLEGFLVTMDIEKVFESLDHNFLIFTSEKYGFDKTFILWVKILLRD